MFVAACGAEVEPPEEVEVPGFGGSGGEGEPDDCDRDGDGERAASCAGPDCNDRNPAVHSGAAEICDGLSDENCDGTVDEGCDCVPGEVRPCYPPGETDPTRRVGSCTDGLQTCDGDGAWGSCEGAVVPTAEGESCDGVDQDCDGTADEDVRNACGVCGELPVEICGNGLDDDCDGVRDDPDRCSVRCDGVDWDDPQPAALACCVQTWDGRSSSVTPSRTAYECEEWPGLPSCIERECLDLDGDPSSPCEKRCADTDGDGAVDRCLCGELLPGHDPVAYEGCGFESPCALQDCAGRIDQPCYSGPPQTLGVGVCRGGRSSCEEGEAGRAWSSCVGEVLPAHEVCDNGIDDDCDGAIDEEDGATGARCPPMACPPEAVERCGNGVDDDCDGFPDDGCAAADQPQPCYGGPIGTRGVGACSDGTQAGVDGRWGVCEGQVLPAPERCGDGIDSDCNGLGQGDTEDPGCCIAAGEETCNGVDDDCDGLVDEGVSNACGRCDGRCFTELLEDPADCTVAGRSCDGVTRDPFDPAALALRADAGAVPTQLYVGRVGSIATVARLDGETGAIAWETTVGSTPSDVVASHDGSAWAVGAGTIFHLAPSGEVRCEAWIGQSISAAAVDPVGHLWVASGSVGAVRLHQIDGTAVLPPLVTGGPVRCRINDLAPGDPNRLSSLDGQVNRMPVALGVAADGTVWLASSPVLTWRDDRWSATAVNDLWMAGGTLDEAGDFWAAGEALFRIDGAAGTARSFPLAPAGTRLGRTIATRAGAIWALCHPVTTGIAAGVLRFEPATESSTFFPVGVPSGGWSSGVQGLAEDALGRLLTVFDNQLRRLDPSSGTWTDLPAANGTNARLVARELSAVGQLRHPRGSWSQVIDGGFHDIEWTGIDWEGSVPAGSSVQVEISAARTSEELDAAVCGPWESAPVDLRSCGEARGRFVRVVFHLTGGPGGERPSIRNVALSWSRP
ncbi:MopE-related protein [Vulgatibacter sp.]|uniref:MopE-related protein n=1 Tax=Vulgatibacter sp. TaxID=1971226 RepID=UPI00356A16CC